ncbi:EamA family transporter RarD [Roseofilum reptotaenium CS-1145]|uniref:Transporter n=1 Tax=Roseofilum reptotaenium AO1-A TaxID=1925591 RepID=A0A1L9QNH9_9CYAN|nr:MULTISPECIES: EamA family transporter RarD [Roseofilum]MBP0029355.1 EamA family transporter RarD [Roseofilum sp. Guam]MDB9518653.1 EamA family transporter RarD [Roseofilum reptotaenium CS-1145]OJJ24196.1 transporter [Roseofilum reptotaenium AO1-A]
MQRVLIKLNIGIFYAVLAYGTWGLIPLYWKLFEALPEMEIICHRMIWSSLLLLVVSAMQQQLTEVKRLWRSPKTLAILLATAGLTSLNGGIYIYGVNSDRVLEASLGYFINPLFSIFLGFVFLREKLNIGQWIAVILVMIGVGYLIWEQGQIPWIAIGLALSFGLYGLVRKLSTIQPIPGLAVESLLIAPIALALVMHWAKTGSGNFGLSLPLTFLLFSCGLVAPLPLLWFNLAVKRINLSTLGFLQYIEPTIQLILAVFLYQEPFTRTHLISFSLIWIALAIYSSNSLISLNPNQKC